ncbi:GIY-YIG nuclease family protein [Spirosoma validum]|uniref:GIY-YIG nuclease family protein n=1 Tax=Spirosoma validum TaxID=2771355 RepID=A0A927GDK0_9BACT|nr:GIY-YIG nuclease family protein [Spirosoma validum]MBD2753758.1 GIY-YIG nuclease family protein [Spirosoma validum]
MIIAHYNFPGIYKFTNKINGKVYVGQSVNICRRYYTHGCKSQEMTFGYAIRKYGKKNFEFEVLERVDDTSQLKNREQYWMDYYQSYESDKGYNILRLATDAGKRVGRKATEKQIEATRARGKAQVGEKNPMYGKKRSDELKAKLSAYRKGVPVPESRLKQLIEHNKVLGAAKRVKIDQIDPQTGKVLKVWESARKVAEALGIHRQSIPYRCRGINPKNGKPFNDDLFLGFRWQFHEQ